MPIAELIKKLQEIQNKHADALVGVAAYFESESGPIDEISINGVSSGGKTLVYLITK